MKLYNTLSRKIEELQPINPPAISLYACGPTVYDFTHLGHLRKYMFDDVLVRTLRHQGFQVKFVQNITDVGHLASDGDTGQDKLEKGAKKYGQSVWEVAQRFEDYFWYSVDLMGNLRPDVSAKATDHIKQQLEMVKTLEKKGFTYLIKGDGLYFDTSKIDDYGALTTSSQADGLDVEALQAGARVEPVVGKKQPSDFALWKFERPGEERAMVWPSPWAERSFPGWHIECSAMSIEHLGPQIDIHTGGKEHIGVHHPNEIAQSEAATGKRPFVRYWVHHNWLQAEGKKMSKSLDNFFTIDDVLKRGFHPKALRLLFLSTHYRSEMNFTWKNLAGSLKALGKLVLAYHSWQESGSKGQKGQKQGKTQGQADVSSAKGVKLSTKVELSVEARGYQTKFWAAMTNDLKTPEASAVMWQVVNSHLPGLEKRILLDDFDQSFGLDLAHIKPEEVGKSEGGVVAVQDLPQEVKQLIGEREQARKVKDWAKADQLRAEVKKLGYLLEDRGAKVVVRAVF